MTNEADINDGRREADAMDAVLTQTPTSNAA
jgi:hypothetical protein